MFKNVDVHEAQQLMAQGVTVVDVRESKEWSAGHIAGARLVPLSTIRVAAKENLPRRKVLFVCAAGVRSQLAARLAAEANVTQIYNLLGGTSAWSKAGLPLARELDVAV